MATVKSIYPAKRLKKEETVFESKFSNCISLLYYFNMSVIMLILSLWTIYNFV